MPKRSLFDSDSGSDSGITHFVPSPQKGEGESDLTFSYSGIIFEQLNSATLTRIGDYELCREIGRGGMGIVYEATEMSLNRRVALKVLPVAANLDSLMVKRFNNESRVAAQLNHPNIIPVYAVGATDGVNFFAMHLVEGRNINQLIKEIRFELLDVQSKGQNGKATVNDLPDMETDNRLGEKRKSSHAQRSDSPHDERVELSAADFVHRSGHHSTTMRAAHAVARLGAKVADALQHAHDMGIIHRDIKPSNLMLDLQGKVWVTDFGLAHVKSAPSMTRTGVLLGTLRYMSPEQATGVRALVDHRTDIYSLGVTLYELLTLRRLIDGHTMEEILRQVIYNPPVRIKRMDPAVPEDLAVILEKAMSKNPAERYMTAGEMAEDLNRFLRNEAIKAKRPNLLKRCKRWMERHRAVAQVMGIAIACIFLISLVATGAIWRSLLAETVQRERAEVALTLSEALRLEANASLELPTDPGLSLQLALKGEKGSPGLEANRIIQAAIDASHEYASVTPREVGSTYVAISPDAQTVVSCAARGVRDSGSYPAILHSMKDGSVLRNLNSGDCITSAAFGPSGGFLVTASKAMVQAEGTTLLSAPPVLWETSTGKKVRVFSGTTLVQAHPGVFNRVGDRIVLGQGNEAHVYDVAGGSPKVTLRGHVGQVLYAEFSPNSERILTVSEDSTIRIWDSQVGRELCAPIPWKLSNNQSPTANFVASSLNLLVSEGRSIKLYSVDTFAITSSNLLATASFSRVAVSRSREQVAVFGGNNALILSSKNLELICKLNVQSRITDVRFHPTEAKVLVICGKQVFVFDSDTGELMGELRGHAFTVTDACFASNSPKIATVSNDGTLRLWHTESGLTQRTFQSPRDACQTIEPQQIALSPDDSAIAICSREDYFTSVRNSNGARELSEMSGMVSDGVGDSEQLVTVRGKTVIVSESSTSREIYRGVFSDDLTPETQLVDRGRKLLVHTKSFGAFLVDLQSHSRRRLGEEGDRIATTCVAADSSMIVLVSGGGRYFAIESATGDLLWNRRHELSIADIDLSPDRQKLALVDIDGNVVIRMTDGEKPIAVIKAVGRPVNQVKFVLDGQRLVTWHSLENRDVHCYDTQKFESHTAQVAEGRIRLAPHRTLPLLAIATDKHAIMWNYQDESAKSLSDRGCRAIRLLEDRVAMLLARSSSQPAALQIRSITDDHLVHEENLEYMPWTIVADLRRNQFLVTQLGYSANVFDFLGGKFAFSSPAHAGPIVFAGFSAKHGLITVSEDGLILILNETGNVLHRVGTLGQKVTAAALDAKGEVLMVGSEAGELALWSVQHGTQVALTGHKGPIRLIRIDGSGIRAVTVASDEPVLSWDLRTHAATELKIANARHAEISGNNTLVITGDVRSSKNKAWLFVEGQNQGIELPQSQDTSMGLFSPDGQRIGLLASDGKLAMLQVEDQKVEFTIHEPSEHIVRFAFAPDGKSLLTAQSNICSLWSVDSHMKKTQVADSRSRHTPNGSWSPFSHDSQWFLSTDVQIRKCTCVPAEFAQKSVFRELTEEERRRFRLDLTDVLRESN